MPAADAVGHDEFAPNTFADIANKHCDAVVLADDNEFSRSSASCPIDCYTDSNVVAANAVADCDRSAGNVRLNCPDLGHVDRSGCYYKQFDLSAGGHRSAVLRSCDGREFVESGSRVVVSRSAAAARLLDHFADVHCSDVLGSGGDRWPDGSGCRVGVDRSAVAARHYGHFVDANYSVALEPDDDREPDGSDYHVALGHPELGDVHAAAEP